jgi:lipoate-protein ligase A
VDELSGPGVSARAAALAGADLPAAVPPVVRVRQVRDVVVVLPRSRRPEREVHLQRCREDGVAVLVRPSGGGAVVLSPGMVAASVLAFSEHAGILPEPHFRRFGAAVTRALAACGVRPVTQRGISDLCLGDRKIAGSSLRLWRHRVLYQVSLLVEADLSLLDRYLPMPSRQPDYRGNRPHRAFVTSLAAAGYPVSVPGLAAALRVELRREVSASAPGNRSEGAPSG